MKTTDWLIVPSLFFLHIVWKSDVQFSLFGPEWCANCTLLIRTLSGTEMKFLEMHRSNSFILLNSYRSWHKTSKRKPHFSSSFVPNSSQKMWARNSFRKSHRYVAKLIAKVVCSRAVRRSTRAGAPAYFAGAEAGVGKLWQTKLWKIISYFNEFGNWKIKLNDLKLL
jgi:hypothetical protein